MTTGLVKRGRPEVSAKLVIEDFTTLVELVQKLGRAASYDLMLTQDNHGKLKLLYRPPYQHVPSRGLDNGE